ncbi:hypothetical protein [Desulfovibrio sp. An276]|uniref:hypothetical protein n=1 Tax=Desulfovibrio sp. An276 TaxID=1965618 RepID=UPI00118615BC|nr:hypothetical protein [Desulfovibrio sp. An276]
MKKLPRISLFLFLPFLLLIFLYVGSNKTYAAEPVYATNVSSQAAMDRIQLGNWHVANKFVCIPEDGSKNTFLTCTENGKTETSQNYSVRTNIFAVFINNKGIPNKMEFTLAFVDERLLNDTKLNTQNIVVRIDKGNLYTIKKFKKRVNGPTITFEWDTKIANIISQAQKGKKLHV